MNDSIAPFSALISVYHKENHLFLKRALQSIWDNQLLKPTEIIIIKDGPLTKDLDLIIDKFSSYTPTKIISFKENKGLGEALKIGVEKCKYNIIARMDSDDISHPQRFIKQINYLYKNKHLSIIGSAISEFIDNEDNIVSYRTLPNKSSDIYSFSKIRCPFNHMSVCFRKKDILASGNYSSFLLFEDYYLWVRVLTKGYQAENMKDILVNVRIDNMIQKRKGLSYIKSEFMLQKKFLHLGFINLFEFYRNITIRNAPRLLPNKILSILYAKILRNKK